MSIRYASTLCSTTAAAVIELTRRVERLERQVARLMKRRSRAKPRSAKTDWVEPG